MNPKLPSVVEEFADLAAELDDPFATREEVFARSGLDDPGYRKLVDGWRARFREDATGQLAARFAWAYAEARKKPRRDEPRSGDHPAAGGDPRFLNSDAQAFREEAARVAREPVSDDTPAPPIAAPSVAAPPIAPSPNPSPAPAAAAPIAPSYLASPPIIAEPPRARLDATIGVSDSIPRESLPFAAAGPPPAPPPPASPKPPLSTGTAIISAFVPRHHMPFPASGPPPAPPPPAPPPPTAAQPAPSPPPNLGVARPPQHLAGTADISSFVPRAATPFAPAPAAAPQSAAPAAPPRKRLIRFDPQTGQPLPAPIWVDLPPEPETK